MTDNTPVTVRPMTAADWPSVETIYREGIATGNATFEAEPPSWEAFDAGKLPEHRFVAVAGDEVLGWVAVSPTSTRPVYRGVVEHSVYVAATARGRGVGHLLLDALIASTEAAGIWTIQSGIFPENTASRALHGRHGFRELGTRERIGLMTFGPWTGQWRDNVLVERRSPRAGS
ncbi:MULTISPECIES: GNAT family N-acetyltransferase [unclassified Curtobacterium]|uniref:GNAT family N-acetyltransferase n=1 Tax=unclassified Curtobacterium TaxID=257496 RepID=UPI00034CB8B5|nr:MULTISPECIES: GNAT family N-acetyltransferase [unclassified Curtobacterium]RDH95592.1 phosphinothricin acetyltransferase [Curtobacterium sp. AG1037]